MSSLEDNRECLSTALPVWQEEMSRCSVQVLGGGFSHFGLEDPQMQPRCVFSVGSRGMDWVYSGAPQTRLGGPGGVFLWDLDFAPGPGRSQTWSSWWTSDSRGNHYGGDVGSDGEHLLDTSAFRTRICPRPCPSAPEHPPRVQSVLVTLKSRGLCVPSCDRFSLVVGARGVPGTL